MKAYIRQIGNSRGVIRPSSFLAESHQLTPILERLSINRQQWLQQSQQFEKLYASQFAKKRRNLKKTA
jgi:hypothetical protein